MKEAIKFGTNIEQNVAELKELIKSVLSLFSNKNITFDPEIKSFTDDAPSYMSMYIRTAESAGGIEFKVNHKTGVLKVSIVHYDQGVVSPRLLINLGCVIDDISEIKPIAFFNNHLWGDYQTLLIWLAE